MWYCDIHIIEYNRYNVVVFYLIAIKKHISHHVSPVGSGNPGYILVLSSYYYFRNEQHSAQITISLLGFL